MSTAQDVRKRTLSRVHIDSDQSLSLTHAEEQDQSPEQPRKRARLSCNTCKARKTKCVGIETGACQYCRSLNIPCEADPKARKRPFYRVSGEVYEQSMILLRRFVSEQELPELTVESIQAFIQKLDDAPPSVTVASRQRSTQQPLPLTISEAPAVPAEWRAAGNDASFVQPAPSGPNSSSDMIDADEHPLLQEELGCMLLDSMGKYRYVGADSSIRWNHAARMLHMKQLPSNSPSDPKIIPPLKTGLLPPTSPESAADRSRRDAVYFPPRHLCMQYVSRFFDQIHCIYWFYSAEQFYTRMDHTIESKGTMASSSWLCALYCIFALGSMRAADANPLSPLEQDTKTSLDYLTLAKDLSTAAADEADVDSIKAFGLLSLTTHATCYSITAYLHLGTAVRIGYSLGLHRDVSLRDKDSLERERGRRLWWTIYVLDQEMASRFGYPCSIVENAIFMRTPLATEQILGPGPNTPLGYQALLVSLIQLRKKVNHECFLEPAQSGGRLPIRRVTRCLASLRQWLDGVPTHLRWDTSLHPQHRRAVALLHLRFATAMISVTRPFLLFAVKVRSTNSVGAMSPVKRKIYEQMSNTCIESAESAVQILKRMREDNTLSSLMLLDCQCITEVVWILILALQKLGGAERHDMLRYCLDTLNSMEKVGWAEKVAPELEARVHESGVLEHGAVQPAQPLQSLWPVYGSGDGQQGRLGGDGSGVPFDDVSPSQISVTNLEHLGLNPDGSQFDVFETLNLDNRGGMMDMGYFIDASFSQSQFLFDHLDATYQP